MKLSQQQHVGEVLIAVYLGQRALAVVLLILTEASDQVCEDNLQISLLSEILASVSPFEFLQNSRLILEIKEKIQVVVVVAEIIVPRVSELTCSDLPVIVQILQGVTPDQLHHDLIIVICDL